MARLPDGRCPTRHRLIDAERYEIDNDVSDGGSARLEALAQGLQVGQPAGLQLGLQGLGEFGLAPSFVSQRQQLHREGAGPTLVARGQ